MALLLALLVGVVPAAADSISFNSPGTGLTSLMVCEDDGKTCAPADAAFGHVNPKGLVTVVGDFSPGTGYYLMVNDDVVSAVRVFPRQPVSGMLDAVIKAAFILLGAMIGVFTPMLSNWVTTDRAKRKLIRDSAILVDHWSGQPANELMVDLRKLNLSEANAIVAERSIGTVLGRFSSGEINKEHARTELRNAVRQAIR